MDCIYGTYKGLKKREVLSMSAEISEVAGDTPVSEISTSEASDNSSLAKPTTT